MKKLIVTIICVLFASTSFAQMVGASSIAKQSATKTTLGVKKHEFSIHGGVGTSFGDWGFSTGLKYKYKPFTKFDIRFLLEVEIEGENDKSVYDQFPILPILAGLNYEYRFNNISSMFMDLGVGMNIPLDKSKDDRSYFSDNTYFHYGYYYQNGFTISYETGIVYDDFMFSCKLAYSLNDYTEQYYYSEDFYDLYNYSNNEENYFLTLRLGYRF